MKIIHRWGRLLAVAPTPTITGYSPSSGPVGTQVTISGTNFGDTQGNGSVKFNDVTAQIVSWAAMVVVAVVPSTTTGGLVLTTDSGATATAGTYVIASGLTLTPASGKFRNNQRNDTTTTDPGFTRRDGLASYTFKTTDPAPVLRGKTSFDQYVTDAALFVYANGSFFRKCAFSQTGALTSFTLSGLPAGENAITVFEGGSFRAGEQGATKVINLVDVTAASGYTLSEVSFTKRPRCIIFDGNSRTLGGASSEAPRTAYSRQVGELLNADVYLIGYNSRQLGLHLNTDALRQQLVNEVSAYAAGYSEVYYVQDDPENDHAYGGTTPAQLMAYNQALLPALHQAVPGLKAIFQTVLPDRDNNQNNVNGYTHADYDAATRATVNGFSYASVLEASTFNVTATDYADAAHLGDSGETKKAAAYQSFIQQLNSGSPATPATPTYQTVNYQDFEGSLSLPASYDPNASYVVVNDGTATTGTNSIKVTAATDTAGTGPLDSFTEGAVEVDLLTLNGAGTTYHEIQLNRSGNNRYVLSMVAVGGQTTFYLQRKLTNVSQELSTLRAADSNKSVTGYYVRSRLQRQGNTVSCFTQRKSDGLYLDQTGTFSQSSPFAWASFTDDAPLPAGTARLVCYHEQVSASNAGYYDTARVQKYA